MSPIFPDNDFSSVSDPKIEIRNTGREMVDLPSHSHDFHQIIHTVSGTLRIQVGERSYFIPERHLAWIPPGISHLLSSNNRHIELQVIYTRLPFSASDEFTVLRSSSLTEEILTFLSRQAPRISRSENPELYDFQISFLLLLRKTGKSYETPLKAVIIPSDPRLRRILDYIDEHLDEDLRIESLSGRFGFSKRNLSRLFQKSGLRLTDYVNYQRITRAIELLVEGERSIQEVAFDVGFNSPNHFNRIFKQISGVTPHEYLRPQPPKDSTT